MSESEHQIEIHPAAAKQLDAIFRADRKLAAQFTKRIRTLAQSPYPQDVIVLEHSDTYDVCRTKIGRSWRLLYAVIGGRTLILVLEAISREGAYKGKELETLRNRIQAFLDTFSK
jgi:mRNA-degrading endonuclease RelE of RelBE toxin-antitoxin system